MAVVAIGGNRGTEEAVAADHLEEGVETGWAAEVVLF
jgi:hypothetical protein